MSAPPFEPRDEVFRAEMPSRLEDRETIIGEILEHLKARGCAPDEFFDRLSLDEAISNAVIHGNRNDPEKKVSVRVFCRNDRWLVEVADEGGGFDWKRLLARLRRQGIRDDATSGRGIALILASGADLQFLDGGSRVRISRGM